MWWLTSHKNRVKYLQLYITVKNIERKERVQQRAIREESRFLLTRGKDGRNTFEKLPS